MAKLKRGNACRRFIFCTQNALQHLDGPRWHRFSFGDKLNFSKEGGMKLIRESVFFEMKWSVAF